MTEKDISRRRYLKGAAGVGATLAAAGCSGTGGGSGATNTLELLH